MLARLLLAASALALATGAARAPAIDVGRVSADVKVLASDAYEGRGPGTAGEDKAVAFITDAFKRIGLQPAGENGGWTQAVTLNRFAVEGHVSASLTAAGRTTALRQGEDIVVATRRPGSAHVAIAGAPVVFVGYGVSAPERGWDDFKGYDLHGKVALVLVNDPDFGLSQPGKFEGRGMTYYGRWTYKYEELARRGAAAVLIVHEADAASYGWPTVKGSWTVPQFDVPRPVQERVPVEAWITLPATQALLKAAGKDLEQLRAAARREDFRPVELGATFSTDFQVQTTSVTSRNVLGRQRGSRRPDEVVLYGAHWDHLGTGPPDAKGDRIYNGAADNASGVAGVIELARAFRAGPAPQRSVVLAAWTAEEKGLLGSESYAAHPTAAPLAKTVANINLDMLPIFGEARNVVVTGAGKSDLEDDLARLAKARGLRVDADAHPESGGYFRSDHFPLAKRGVPAIDFHAGSDLVKGGTAAGEAKGRDFNAAHYHQPSDEWSADWDLAAAKSDLELAYALGAELAGTTRWPAWRAEAEFRPARDTTAAQRR